MDQHVEAHTLQIGCTRLTKSSLWTRLTGVLITRGSLLKILLTKQFNIILIYT